MAVPEEPRIVKVKIKTGQPKFSLQEGVVWKISLRSSPEKNKANSELIRELSRLYGKVRIISGMRSRNKTLEIG